MAPAMKIVFGLLTLVTVGMIIGALFQLAFIRRLEDSYGSAIPSGKVLRSWDDGYLKLPRGLSHLHGDQEAEVLRLGYVKPEVISWSPRIIVLHSFLSMQECDYLRAIASPRLQISTVVDTKTGKGIMSDVRTSSGMFLSHEEKKHPTVQAIEKRISVFSQVPVENGELIQVLRYEQHQFYMPHHDYFSDSFNVKYGGQRIATMLMYLSDGVEGGETYFPMVTREILWEIVQFITASLLCYRRPLKSARGDKCLYLFTLSALFLARNLFEVYLALSLTFNFNTDLILV
ncbi:hypothetical protein SLEP1_g45734 [Rubroshorea leprosula]|uniref:Prolyl 4-hydroxylase alpha subunit domain-containing protein n=1 Tax=Rubroshorea leprosula TaxID=152421 RepID=A0AAV5LK04_9ROSI|nr:hypothetical protein SLEP1_g45734 [Rubroshorea leprosula]